MKIILYLLMTERNPKAMLLRPFQQILTYDLLFLSIQMTSDEVSRYLEEHASAFPLTWRLDAIWGIHCPLEKDRSIWFFSASCYNNRKHIERFFICKNISAEITLTHPDDFFHLFGSNERLSPSDGARIWGDLFMPGQKSSKSLEKKKPASRFAKSFRLFWSC